MFTLRFKGKGDYSRRRLFDQLLYRGQAFIFSTSSKEGHLFKGSAIHEGGSIKGGDYSIKGGDCFFTKHYSSMKMFLAK